MEMPSSQFSRDLRVQIRVIKALVKREFIALYGRRGLGFLMMFAEPLVIMGVVMGIVAYSRLRQPSTFPVLSFVLTGWGIMWMCRYPVQRMSGVLRANASFLYHRQITVLDIFFGRTILSIFSTLVSFVLLFLLNQALLGDFSFHDPMAIVVSLLLVIWYTAGMCLLCALLSSYTPLGDRIILVVAAGHIFLTGAFAMMDWLPADLRTLVLYLPMANATELMRFGFFGDIVTCYYDIKYIVFFNIVLTYFTLQLFFSMKNTRDPYDIPY